MTVARSCLVPFGGQAESTGFILPPFFPPTAVQGSLLLLVCELVHGGCLQAALQQADQRQQLAWAARCACWASGACGRGHQSSFRLWCSLLPFHSSGPDTCRGQEAALAVAEALCYLHDTLHICHGNLTARCARRGSWGGSATARSCARHLWVMASRRLSTCHTH